MASIVIKILNNFSVKNEKPSSIRDCCAIHRRQGTHAKGEIIVWRGDAHGMMTRRHMLKNIDLKKID